MKKWMIGTIACAGLILTACGEESEPQSQESEAPQVVEAEIVIPEDIQVQEASKLQVEISQGGEAVEDANEVMFEIWNDVKGEESEQHEAEHIGEGVYEIDYTFEEDSIYSLQTHITARDMHVMPKKQFTVGEVTEEQMQTAEENAESQKSSHMESEDGDHSGHDH
ncbi:FixH family protein [Jeotgalibacillus sp. ET6]|uniref:FixH family protein n=1 Tax=Jeotgalibacillus sp. ET6 TaxID=3037260 RepID=UPI00241815A3|nr:FixH family protein [Jeotgalibacillus sp. ET6]MDG5472173.1 FixH family protein [Jeotgalibacillus sp. ET6]